MDSRASQRRGFLQGMLSAGALAAAAPASAQVPAPGDFSFLPQYARAQHYRSLKQSSYDTNRRQQRPLADRRPERVQEVFNAHRPRRDHAHLVHHLRPGAANHLKELVLRGYWDGNAKPSVEVPIGDFFGLNLGAVLRSTSRSISPARPASRSTATSPCRTSNSARFTVTNEGTQEVGLVLFEHRLHVGPATARRRDVLPCAVPAGPRPNVAADRRRSKLNPDGKDNYVYMETRGRGHLMGVTLGVLQNANGWWGEGDDMIFIDDDSKPAIVGTGSEDYFLGSWNFGGRDGAAPFAHRCTARRIIVNRGTHRRAVLLLPLARRQPGHVRSISEAHDGARPRQRPRRTTSFPCGYWYQAAPFTDFPALPPVAERIPQVRTA